MVRKVWAGKVLERRQLDTTWREAAPVSACTALVPPSASITSAVVVSGAVSPDMARNVNTIYM